jgi:hypothetical protein
MMGDSDPMERLLRERRIHPVADEGFTEQLLGRLPARSSRSRWAVPTFSLLGLLLSAPALMNAHVAATLSGLLPVQALLPAPGLLRTSGVLQSEGMVVLAVTAVGLVWATCAWALLGGRRSSI